METLRPSDMSSRPAGCDSPEPLSSASPKTTERRAIANMRQVWWRRNIFYCFWKHIFCVTSFDLKWYDRTPRTLTQHKDSFEDSKHCSNNYAVLRGGKKVAITRPPDTNRGFICKVMTPVWDEQSQQVQIKNGVETMGNISVDYLTSHPLGGKGCAVASWKGATESCRWAWLLARSPAHCRLRVCLDTSALVRVDFLQIP